MKYSETFLQYTGKVVHRLLLLGLLVSFSQIHAQSPCDFTFTSVGGATDHYQFTSTFAGGCIDYETWTLGDGTNLFGVHNPEHLYLPTGSPTPQSFTVIHTVQFQGQTYTCTQSVPVVFMNPTEPCFNNYFRYGVDGCELTLFSTLADVGAVINLVIDFGDGNSVTNPGSPVTHSYDMPGTYKVTQTYIAMLPGSTTTYTGSCSRPVTVGCCCSDPELEVEYHLTDCEEGPFIIIRTGTECCAGAACTTPPTLTVKVGTNAPVTLNACNAENKVCITNYSTYLQFPDNQIRVTYNYFCHGQALSETLNSQPPFPGIFLGLDPLHPTECDPDNTVGSPFGANSGGPGGPGGDPNHGCVYYYSFLTDYNDVLPGTMLNTNIGMAFDVYVAPNSIIQVNKSFTFSKLVRIFMGPNSGWDVLHRPTSSAFTLQLTNGVQLGLGGCCMWRGVNVYGNGVFSSTTQGGNNPNNIITNALYAVRAFSRFSAAPILTLRNTNFDNNFVSIRGTDGRFRFLDFRTNTFTSSGLDCISACLEAEIDILPIGTTFSSSRSFAGMYLEGGGDPANGILNLTDLILPPVPATDAQVNLFEHQANGIIARNLNVSIRDCVAFDDIQAGVYPVAGNGIGVNWLDASGNWMLTFVGLIDNAGLINGTAFNNCRIGIRAESQTPGNPSDIAIRSCGMNQVLLGIDLRLPNGDFTGAVSNNDIQGSTNGIAINDRTATPSQVVIANNVINVTNTGIVVAGPDLSGVQQVEIGPNNIIESPGLGIQSIDYSRAYIHENTIDGLTTGTGISAVGGQSEIECNTVHDAAIGLSINNNSIFADLSFNDLTDSPTGLQVSGLCPATNLIIGNTFTNSDLQYINGAETGAQFNTGNVWVNSNAFADGSVVVANSLYTVPTGTGPTTVFPANWFVGAAINPPNLTEVCSPGVTGGGGPRSINDNKHYINSATAAKLFPVPVTDMLNLELTSGASVQEYEIVNALGVSLKRNTSLQGSALQIDTRAYPNGIYFIQISTSMGDQMTLPFVIQR